jgi:hypothetical protein
MMRPTLLIAALAALLLAPVAAAKPKSADLILWGGPIYTGEAGRGPVAALAIKDGAVLEAGVRTRIARLRGPKTEILDLRGAAAFPGFTDSHVHVSGVGARELTFNLDAITSIAELAAAVKARAAGMKDGDVLVGRGWIETHWPEARFPTRADLDAAAPGIAVILQRADGHALVANSLALQRAGIDAATFTAATPELRLQSLLAGSIGGINLRLVNAGGVEKVLAATAAKQGTTPAALQKEAAAMAGQIVPMMLGGTPGAASLGQALGAFVANPSQPPDARGIKRPRAVLERCQRAVLAGPGPDGGRGDDVALTVGGIGRRRGEIAVENTDVNQRIERTDRLVVGDVFLSLGGQNVGELEVRRGVHRAGLRCPAIWAQRRGPGTSRQDFPGPIKCVLCASLTIIGKRQNFS